VAARHAEPHQRAHDEQRPAQPGRRNRLVGEELGEAERDEAPEAGAHGRGLERAVPDAGRAEIGAELEPRGGEEPGRLRAPEQVGELPLLGDVRHDDDEGEQQHRAR
jgi:hypothetical protein